MIFVVSQAELEQRPSKAVDNRTWHAFLNGGTSHSAMALTLPAIIRKCEREGIPYQLTAHPGKGYFIQKVKALP